MKRSPLCAFLVAVLVPVGSSDATLAASGPSDPDHTSAEHAYERIEEVRRERIVEPPNVWAGKGTPVDGDQGEAESSE